MPHFLSFFSQTHAHIHLVIVVGVVGKVHCGKSYFLNELFKDARRFRVGPGVNPETQGIWMSVYPKNPAAGGKTVVALDTEGFFSSTTNDDYDAKMFAITTLLSSSLVYNTIKNIDQSQVDYLEILARKTSLFYLKQSSGNNAPFPRFCNNKNNNNNKSCLFTHTLFSCLLQIGLFEITFTLMITVTPKKQNGSTNS